MLWSGCGEGRTSWLKCSWVFVPLSIPRLCDAVRKTKDNEEHPQYGEGTGVGEITLEFPRFPPRMPTVYPALTPPMPSPYTIEQTASASGLSVKFIRRMKEALPGLFEKHTERGPSNALLFDEGMIEILKRTRDLRSRGRTLQQIRDELAALPRKNTEETPPTELPPELVQEVSSTSDVVRGALEREKTLLRSQVSLL